MFVSEMERLERAENFFNKAKAVHGDKFDYSKVEYINNVTKVVIVCKKHGEFLKSPSKHLSHKHSCPECAKDAYKNSRKIDKAEFILVSEKLYGGLYDYTYTEIRRKSDNILIFCKKHNSYFEQKLHLHLSGHIGCKKCLKEKKEKQVHDVFEKKFIDKFTEKFGNYYDFSKVNYVNNTTPVIVKCLKHNCEFLQVHRNIVRYNTCSCKECKKEKRDI